VPVTGIEPAQVLGLKRPLSPRRHASGWIPVTGTGMRGAKPIPKHRNGPVQVAIAEIPQPSGRFHGQRFRIVPRLLSFFGNGKLAHGVQQLKERFGTIDMAEMRKQFGRDGGCCL